MIGRIIEGSPYRFLEGLSNVCIEDRAHAYVYAFPHVLPSATAQVVLASAAIAAVSALLGEIPFP
jgi:hypothetical protein